MAGVQRERDAFKTLLEDFETSLEHLPHSVPLLPISVDGGNLFACLDKKPHLDDFIYLLAPLKIVWEVPERVSKEQVTRGSGGFEVLSRLFNNVGAEGLASLDPPTRAEAKMWLRALIRAVEERTKEAERDPSGPRYGPRPSALAPPPLKSALKNKDAYRSRSMESTKSSQHASEKHVSRAATPSTITSDTPCGIESDDVGEITAGLGARLGRREKTPGPVQTGTIPHPSPSLQKKASTSLKRRTSPSPSPKRAPPPFIPPSIVALPSSSTAPGPAFNVGDGVMAKYERHGWWPSVVLDPETAPKGAGRVSGERTPTALLVKRLPQGGDWSFISPPNVRRLRPDERARAEHHLADLTSTKLGSQAKRYPREYLRGINLAQGDSSALLPYTIPYVRGSPASGPGTPLERALESKEVVEMRQRRELERAAKYQSKGEDQKKVIKRRSVEVIVID